MIHGFAHGIGECSRTHVLQSGMSMLVMTPTSGYAGRGLLYGKKFSPRADHAPPILCYQDYFLCYWIFDDLSAIFFFCFRAILIFSPVECLHQLDALF